jgi:hypothetical protein
MIAGQEFAADFGAHPGKQRVHGNQKFFRRQSAPLRIPHPFVAHGAHAALQIADRGDAAQCGGNHVAMLQSSDKAGALLRVVAQPVQ